MEPNDEARAFFNAGMVHYPAAKKAVSEFTNLLVDELEKALRRRDRLLRLDDQSKIGKWSVEQYVYVLCALRPDGPLKLELGIWWEAPEPLGPGTMVYAGVYSDSGPAMWLPPGTTARRITRGKAMYVGRVFQSGIDFAELLDNVLDDVETGHAAFRDGAK